MITVQTTPNPNALKFIVPDRWMNFVWECHDAKDAAKSDLARDLFAIDGVVYMMFGYDFVSVSKRQDVAWDNLKGEVLEKIDEFLQRDVGLFETKDLPPMYQEKPSAEKGASKGDSYIAREEREYNELELKIINVLEEKVQPVLASHGGMVRFVSFCDGVVVLDLQGACKGCPSSAYTLKNGIENLLKYYFPEVSEVASVE